MNCGKYFVIYSRDNYPNDNFLIHRLINSILPGLSIPGTADWFIPALVLSQGKIYPLFEQPGPGVKQILYSAVTVKDWSPTEEL